MKLFRKRFVAALAALAAITAVGLVYAAWTSSGSGSAYSKAGTAQTLSTVDVSASTSATLYPGVTGDALVKFSNPNPYPVKVTAVSLNGTNASIVPDSGHGACTTTGVSFTNQTGLSIVVPSASGGTNGTAQAALTGAVSMSSASVDGCQGAVFTIPVTFAGTSN